MQISVFARTLKQAKADAETLIREKAREGYSFTRISPRKTGRVGMLAYEVEVTFAKGEAA